MLACDVDVDDHAAPLLPPVAVHGVGELETIEPSPASESESSPVQLGLGPLAEAGEATASAGVGLRPREKDAIGWIRWTSSSSAARCAPKAIQ